MSVVQMLAEIRDELVRVMAECDGHILQVSLLEGEIKSLQAELRKACAERDEAVEHAARLQAQLAEVKSQLEAVVRERYNLQAERNTLDKQLQELIMSQPDFGVERMPKKNKPESQLVKEILSAMDQEEADDAPTEPKKPKKPVKTPAGQSDLVRDVAHYTEAAEVDAPTEPENCGFEGKILQEVSQPVQTQEVTLSAYVVGDTVSPGALRIVWATEEWIEQSKFGIVHAMKDVMFLDHDRFTDPEQFSLTLMLNK